jgi:hypothetical protein
MSHGALLAVNGDGLNDHVSDRDAIPNGHANGEVTNGVALDGKSIKNNGVNGHDMNGHVSDHKAYVNGINGGPVNGHSHKSDSANGDAIRLPPDTPIAICGMACRLPGGLHTPQQLWEFLLAKGDARTRVPESRYNVAAYHDPSGKPGTVKTEYGYFLDVDLHKADGAFSSSARGALEKLDPHQLQMMEVARECIEDAGEVNWRGALIGCYVGSFGEDWVEMFAKDVQQYGLYRVGGYGDFMLANHVSYEMDFRGPRYEMTSNLG